MMPPKLTLAAVIMVVLCAHFISAQTASDLAARYGEPAPDYAVGEHISMTPEYSADGQVCRMRLFPKKINGRTNYLSEKIPFEELMSFLNALVPVGERGNKILLNFGATATGGPAAWTIYGYERVTFTFISAYTPARFDNLPLLKKGEYKFSLKEAPADREPENLAPAADDFRNRQGQPTNTVTIIWNSRKCASIK